MILKLCAKTLNNSLQFFKRLLPMLLAASPALAIEQAQLVKDINTTPNVATTALSNLCEVNNLVFFSEKDDIHGTELWVSDGTGGGTHMVKDINPGGDSSPQSLVAMGSTLYFAANDGSHGIELWKSDGTAAGTVLVKDICPGSDGYVGSFAPANGWLYFSAYDPDHGVELWKTDGTEAGTTLVKDINPGPANGGDSSQLVVAADGTVFFTGTDTDHGKELWKTDGTEAGTVLVKDLVPGAGTSSPDKLTAVGNSVFFTAYSAAATGMELWVSDGTSDGTVLVQDMTTGTGSTTLGAMAGFNGALYFRAGAALWKTGGTAATTAQVVDNVGHTINYTNTMVVAGSRLFINGSPNVANIPPSTLWSTDGTTHGTIALTTTNQGGFQNLRVSGDSSVLFSTSNPYQLWESDGTVAGTTAFVQLASSPEFPTAVTAHQFFLTPYATPVELWKTDGTAAGTVKVPTMAAGTRGSYPGSLTGLQGKVVFFADDGTHGTQPWASDGTSAGTMMLQSASAGSEATFFTVMGGAAYFQSTVYPGNRLWKTDGTVAGTANVAAAWGSTPTAVLGGSHLLFLSTYNSPAHGGTVPELFSLGTSGTATDIYPSPAGKSVYNFGHFTVMSNQLFFTAVDAAAVGTSLYKTNGTTVGTSTVLSGQECESLIAAGSTLFFFSSNATTGAELWKTDGTPVGTALVKDINPGAADSVELNAGVPCAALGSLLIFAADDGVHGIELWKSDGTPAGTVLLADIAPGVTSSRPYGFMTAGDHVFFTANDQVHGTELWVTDGTAWGTHLAADVMPGGIGSGPVPLMAEGGVVYFSASDDATDMGLWRSDGSAAGTFRAALPPTGASDWLPVSMAAAGGKLFVSAKTLAYGQELFTVTAPTFDNLAPTQVTGTSAVLNANVIAAGTVNTAEFHYGLTSSYGSIAAVTPAPGSSPSLQVVSAPVDGLQPGTTYHFQVVVTSDGTPTSTTDAAFSTTPGLVSLVPGTGTLSPAFDADITSYAVTVPNTTSSFAVTPTVSGANSTLAVNGAVLVSGTASQAVPLSLGLNTVPVVVTAQDGVTTRTYVLQVTRLLPAPGTLAFDAASYEVAKSGGHATVNVARSGGVDGTISVNLTTKNGTALASTAKAPAAPNNQYVATSMQLTFGQGETVKQVDIPVVAASPAGPNKAFGVVLSTAGIASGAASLGAAATANVVIIDATSATATGDARAPAAPVITTPAANAILPLMTGGTLALAGTVSDNKAVHRVQVSLNGGAFVDAALTAQDAASTAWSLVVTPASSKNTLRVQSFDLAGHASAIVTRSFTITRALLVNVTGPDASGTVSAGFEPSSFREPGKTYAITATAKAGFLFNGWSVSDATGTGITALKKELPGLSFIMQPGLVLTANFIANPFLADYATGAYEGLVRADPANPAPNGTTPDVSTEGSFTAMLMGNGTFTGSLFIDGLKLPVAGLFDGAGVGRFGPARATSLALPRPGKPSLVLALQIALNNTGISQINGSVTVSDRNGTPAAVSLLASYGCPFDGRTPATLVPEEFMAHNSAGTALKSGTFAFAIPAGRLVDQPAGYTVHDYPQGGGFGILTVTSTGAFSFSGRLADDTPFTTTAKLARHVESPYRRLSLFVPLYGGRGFVSSELGDANNDLGSLTSTDVRWSCPYRGGQYYPYGWPEIIHAGFVNAKIIVAPQASVLYGGTAVGPKAPPLACRLIFVDGGLPAALTKHLSVTWSDSVIKNPAADASFNLSIVHSTGQFSGTFTGADGRKRTYSGISGAGGYGFFLSPMPAVVDGLGESGAVGLQPTP